MTPLTLETVVADFSHLPASPAVVMKLLERLRVKLTREIAVHVYTTLVTDTGNFRYSNTDASVFALAKKLVEAGVVPWDVSKKIFENFPVARLKLLGKVLPTLEISADAQVASLVLSQAMLRDCEATADLADEFINYPRSLNTVEVAILFRKRPEGKWKVSFRSKDRIDVAKLAAQFSGGGHARAAGCTFEGLSLEQVRQKIFAAVGQVLS